ncbi:MAG: LPS-assembly protein LptD [Ignavibacteria bacterium]|nr:LPS-assembly protein LptD [Ignavibacteria bacterium]
MGRIRTPVSLLSMSMKSFGFLILLSVLASTPSVVAQVPSASREPQSISADTSTVVLPDTLILYRSDVDTVVVYSARDSISYSMNSRFMRLYGSSEIKYQAIGLKAARIGINWDNATLEAEGAEQKSDTGETKIIGSPILIDGREEFKGEQIGYNFRTKKGRITLGTTEMEGGYYHGDRIKKVEPDVLFVADGRYTTCDLEEPHFYFFSPKMKVILREVVIAEPVYFYIADVPVFALPFGVFPNRAGRRSGIIAPAYGEDARYGRYLSHFGYYWAISDYLDLSSTVDLYSRGTWVSNSMFRYALRYNFTGSVMASVARRVQGEAGDPDRSESRDYSVQLNHYQQIDPTSNLSVNFNFSSGSYFRNYSRTIDEILRQNIVSNASYSKTWTETNRSLSLSLRRDLSLVTDDLDELLPSISFTQGTFFPFKKRGGGNVGGEQEWYEQIGISYGVNASNQRTRTSRSIDSIKTGPDELSQVKQFQQSSTQTILQNMSLSFSPKLGHISVSPFFSFRDDRLFGEDKTPFRNKADSSVGFTRQSRRHGKGFLSTGISSGTRFYGIAQPNVWGITALRHTVSPNLSLTYGKQVYGADASPFSLSSSLNVQNLFEMKYQPSDTAQEQKIQLMNIGMNLSYDFTRPEQRLSELFISYRTDLGRNLSLSAGTSHNFYEFDPVLQRRVNRFLIKEQGYLADLTSFNVAFSLSLSGQRKARAGGTTAPAEIQAEQDRLSQPLGGAMPAPQGMQGYQDESSDFSIPWNVSLNFNFSQSQSDPRVKTRSASISTNLSFNLTEQWKISASGNYDFTQKRFAAPTINLSRDLHCWIMNFSWYPIGFYRGYRLEIRVKAPQLQDIKVTKQDSERGVYF